MSEQRRIDIETFGGAGAVRHHAYGQGGAAGGRGGPGGYSSGGGRGGGGGYHSGGRGSGNSGGYQGRGTGYQGTGRVSAPGVVNVCLCGGALFRIAQRRIYRCAAASVCT